MKRNGNLATNQALNPKNKKPDIPLDADEVDSAMERYIRKKYQEKSLESGRPEPPSRTERSPIVPPKSPDYEPVAPVPPPKKHRFFGFGLRASASALPLSRHDKKKLPPEPRVDSAFTISGDDYGSMSRMSDAGARMSDAELQLKVTQLKDMGFPNREVNTKMLRRMNGDVERTIEALVQMRPQPAERTSSAQRVDPNPTGSSKTNVTTAGGSDSTHSGIKASHTGTSRRSNNPFDQLPGSQSFGLSFGSSQPTQPQQQQQPVLAAFASNNPFDQTQRSQTDSGLTQAFQNMQVSQPAAQPLFPHSTGGYPNQQGAVMENRFQTASPGMGPMSQQYGYTASPAALPTNSNPFFQQQQQSVQQMQPQQTGYNPFVAQQQQLYQQPAFAPQSVQAQAQTTGTNPFMPSGAQQQSPSVDNSFNPFGIPPSGASPPPTSQGYQQQQLSTDPGSAIGVPGLFPAGNPFQQQMAPQQQQPAAYNPFPNYQHGQQQGYQQPTQQFSSNPYSTLPQSPPQAQGQYMHQGQAASMAPQQTGRYDKNAIMALYNYPSLVPGKQPALSSIPEPSNTPNSGQQAIMPGGAMMGKRSSTMPVSMSMMHSAGGGGNALINRNPFMQNSGQAASGNMGIASHSSRDSVAINNLESGRHSPDAFASLSARHA